VEQARLHLDRRAAKKARLVIDDLLFSNPGRCENYLLAARWQALKGANTVARDFFETSIFCDPGLAEGMFYAADFARLAGDVTRARVLFDKYLAESLPRRSDEIRELRRRAATRWSSRLAHKGVVITDASCRPAGGAWVCSGTLLNTTTEPLSGVKVEVRGKRQLGSSTVESIDAGAAIPFGVRIETKSLADVVISAGRDRKERKLNETPAR
jgi:hypothetical protein